MEFGKLVLIVFIAKKFNMDSNLKKRIFLKTKLSENHSDMFFVGYQVALAMLGYQGEELHDNTCSLMCDDRFTKGYFHVVCVPTKTSFLYYYDKKYYSKDELVKLGLEKECELALRTTKQNMENEKA